MTVEYYIVQPLNTKCQQNTMTIKDKSVLVETDISTRQRSHYIQLYKITLFSI